MTLENLKSQIGKKFNSNLDWGTCYPVVAYRARNAKHPIIIDVISAEFGSHGTENNGTFAWKIGD